jgi:DNA polymerase-3 subunit epsilon
MHSPEEMPLAEVPIVVLDTETTGLSPALGHRVVEVAAVRLSGWQETARFSELVNPGRPIEAGATRVHGLVDRDVAGAPPFCDVVGRLEPLLEGAVVVAHNAAFDAGFLAQEYAIASRRGVCPPVLPNPWLCTLLLARRHFHFDRNDLSTVAYRLGVPQSRAHRALNDAYTTASVLQRMVRELGKRGVRTAADLLHAQGGPVFMPAAVSAPLPPAVDSALAGGKRARIRYVTESGGESVRMISPLYTTVRGEAAYLVAYCHLRCAQRTFRLDRILEAELVD